MCAPPQALLESCLCVLAHAASNMSSVTPKLWRALAGGVFDGFLVKPGPGAPGIYLNAGLCDQEAALGNPRPAAMNLQLSIYAYVM